MPNLVEIIIKGIDEATKVFSGVGADLDKLGSKLSSVGTKMTIGITLPILAAGAASIKMASDLNDAVGKTELVFGENADVVEDWAKGLSSSFGLSKRAALEYSTTFGVMFGNMGVASNRSVEMSEKLTQLASDYASFANVPIDQAFSMLQSGLAGRGMELKKFGINLDDATVKSKALEMGLAATADELTAGDLVVARYSIIMDGATKISGDWAKSTGDLDVQLQNMKANAENAAASLGQNLLPLQLKLITIANNLLTTFNNLSPGQQNILIGFLALAAALGPLLSFAGTALTIFASLSTLFGAGGALAGAGTVIGGAFAAISAPVLLLVAALGILIALLVNFGPQISVTISQLAQLGAALIKYMVLTAIQAAQAILDFDWASVGRNIVNGLVGGVKNAATNLVNAVKGVVNNALTAAKNLLGIKSPSSLFALVGQQMMAGMAQGIRGGTRMPITAMQTAAPSLVRAATNNNTFNMNIGSGLDLEQVAYRVAEIIQLKSRR